MTQAKLQEIMAEADLTSVGQTVYDEIAGKICDYADAIAIARCEEVGIEDLESYEAQKIYRAAERTLVAAVLRAASNINNTRPAVVR